MRAATRSALVEDYLKRLERAAQQLPSDRRRELVDDIREHLNHALGPDASDAAVLTALERLGTPEEIATAELPHDPPRRTSSARDTLALTLLLFGGFVFWVGWFAGVALLWTSTSWRTRDKWIGTLVLPGGLCAGAVAFLQRMIEPRGAHHGTAATWLITFLVVAPLATSLYLARSRRPT